MCESAWRERELFDKSPDPRPFKLATATGITADEMKADVNRAVRLWVT
jgi:hypothetical protein